jgi:hypothetical protein
MDASDILQVTDGPVCPKCGQEWELLIQKDRQRTREHNTLVKENRALYAKLDDAMVVLSSYVSQYAGMPEFMRAENEARTLIAKWRVESTNSSVASSGKSSPTKGTAVTPAADTAKPPSETWNAAMERAAEIADYYAELMNSEAARRIAEQIRATKLPLQEGR